MSEILSGIVKQYKKNNGVSPSWKRLAKLAGAEIARLQAELATAQEKIKRLEE